MKQSHDKRCLAHALICAIENLRDSNLLAIEFAMRVAEGTPSRMAEDYLDSGTVTCRCNGECYHPLSCPLCQVIGDRCGGHKAGQSGHERCSGQ